MPGALLTLGVIAVLTADERFLGSNVPNPGVVLALPVIHATWTGGWRGALFSVLASMCFVLWKYALPGAGLSYTPEDAGRIVVIALVLPMIASMVAWLRTAAQLAAERDVAEGALRTYARFISSSSELQSLVDGDYRFKIVNGAFLKALGKPEPQVVGHTVAELFGEEFFRTVAKAPLDRALAGEEMRFETWMDLPAAGRRYLTVGYAPVRDEDGGITAVTANARDITDLKSAETALRESEARIRNIFAQASDGIFVISGEHRYEDANQRGLDMLGYTREELLGLTVADAIAPYERPRLAAEPVGMMAGKPHLAEWDHVRKDGTIFPAEVSARRLDDQTYIAVVRDLTARRQTDAAAREAAERLRLAVQAGDVGLWDWDLRTDQVVYSREWKSQLGYEEHEIGNDFGEWERRVHTEDLAPTLDRVRSYLDRPAGALEVEFRMRHKDGSWRWIHARGEVIRDPDGRPMRMLGCHVDVTERRQAEDRIRESEEHLRRVLDSTFLFIGVMTPDGTLIEVNRSPLEVAGIRREDVIGRKLWDCYWLSYSPTLQARVRLATERAALGEACRYDMEVRAAGGTLVPIDFMLAPMRGADGGVAFLVPSGVPITERKRAEEHLLGLNRVLRMIAADTALEETLEALLKVIEAHEPELLSSILLLDADGIHVRHGAAPRLPPDFVRAIDGQPIGPRAGSCGTAAYRREPVIVTDIGTDPLWEDYRALAAAHGLAACWSTPIMDAAGIVLGTFAIYYRQPCSPPARHRRIVEVAVQMAAIAIESTRHERDLRESRQRLEALSHRLIDIQEEERRALARELHDEIGQVLTAVKLSLEAERLGAGTEVRRARLTGCVELVDNAIQQVRDRSLDLRPSMLDDLGLIPTLQWYLEQRGRSDNCEIEFEADPLAFRLAPAVEIACYRVVQEAITNVLRHSQARHARVRVAAGDRALELTVSDDGRGFDVNEARRRGVAGERFGLLGMEERVSLAGGRMTITSAPGRGTEVRATLPYTAPQA